MSVVIMSEPARVHVEITPSTVEEPEKNGAAPGEDLELVRALPQ